MKFNKNDCFICPPALSTHFNENSKNIKDRFANVFNMSKKRRGIFPLLMVFACIAVSGMFVACQDKAPDVAESGYSGYASNEAETAGTKRAAEIWAKAWQDRDGRARYDIMSESMQKEFYEAQLKANGEAGLWSIGWSSPWVLSYEVAAEGNGAVIKYCYTDSTGAKYEGGETIITGKENGKTVVIESRLSEELKR